MKSGLEDRNNAKIDIVGFDGRVCLNEVRPGRPEQCRPHRGGCVGIHSLNEVRPGRPEQCHLGRTPWWRPATSQ